MKLKHYQAVRVEVIECIELFEVTVYNGYFNPEILGHFWLPLSAKDKHGWVHNALIRSRMKHDYGITYDHYSYCSMLAPNHPRLVKNQRTIAIVEEI